MKTGKDDMTDVLTRCEEEPIHVPGSIQPHGVLLVLSPEDASIRQVSANCEDHLGHSPEELLGTSFDRFLSKEKAKAFRREFLDLEKLGSNPLRIAVETKRGKIIYDGIAHQSGEDLVLELEDATPADQADGPSSRGVDHHFGFTQRVLHQIRDSATVEDAAREICEELRGFTGFDRVMVYRFAPDFHGEVIAEDRRDDLEPFLGLHYPASDIPRQARELYKRNWIRLIQDVDAEPAPLVPAERELDMSQSCLRSVSPIHIQYLKNMGVTSSMSISLMNGEELWGLIACHHYSGPKFVPYTSRTASVHFGLVVSSQLVTKEREIRSSIQENHRKQLIRLSAEFSQAANFFEALKERADALMKIVRADGIGILQEDRVMGLGSVPDHAFILHLIETLETETPVLEWFDSACLTADLPELTSHPTEAAGVLIIGLGSEWQLLFFRGEVKQTVRWAGSPEKPSGPDEMLTPRKSFKEFLEVVNHRSRPWDEIDILMANELRSSLMAFTVQQNIQLERLNRELESKSKEIEQFAYSISHDLKSPLVTVNGFVGALEEDLAAGDEDGARDALKRIKRATDRMGTLIEELLAFSRIGRLGLEKEEIDMDTLAEELRMEFEHRLAQANASLNIEPELPRVIASRSDIYRAFHNLVSNALRHCEGTEDLEIGISGERRSKSVRFTVSDNGPGIEPEYHDRIFELFQRIDQSRSGTGVGLASVAKIAALHQGKCGVNSSPGQGASFWIEFPAKFRR